MGSTTSSEECGKCEGIVQENYDYRSHEVYKFCNRCGYYYEFFRKLDGEGKVIFEVTEQGETPVYETNEHEGFGTYRIISNEGPGSGGGFHEPINDEIIAEFKRVFSEEDTDQDKSYLIRFENGKLEVLFGNPPEEARLLYREMLEKYHPEETQAIYGFETEVETIELN